MGLFLAPSIGDPVQFRCRMKAEGAGSESPTVLPESEDGLPRGVLHKRPTDRRFKLCVALPAFLVLWNLEGRGSYADSLPSLGFKTLEFQQEGRKMITIENAEVACVTVKPAICFDANGDTYRIELSPLEVWRLRQFADLLLSHYPNRDFEAENMARNRQRLEDFRSRSSQPAMLG